jgi:hypothetical protein
MHLAILTENENTVYAGLLLSWESGTFFFFFVDNRESGR